MSNAEMHVRRELRESLTIQIKTMRTKLRAATDPIAARVIDGVLRDAEERLARLLENGAN